MADNFYNFDINTGVVIPNTADIKTGVQAVMKDALGEDISLHPSTPQGRLIDAWTKIRAEVVTNNARMINMMNFALTDGLSLDAMAATFGIERTGATSSKVSATLTGTPSTLIQIGRAHV